MHKKDISKSRKMVATKSKNKVLSCSTPEHRQESPSRDSDSLYDSDAASPVPFLCTQDGAEGETDVVWNFYTPKSEHVAKSRLKNSTPIRRAKRIIKTTVIEKPLPKRRTVRATQKKTELFQDLIELNQNLHELIAKKTKPVLEEKIQPGSEEDIFSDSDSSLKTGFRTNSRCLRRNVLSSKFNKPETETALESDDSMNECLIKASQVVEENILNSEPTPAKRPCLDFESKHTQQTKPIKPSLGFKMDHDSMDAILNSIKLESPILNKTKTNSSRLINDSFDSLVGNLNDSTLDRLTQMPAKTNGSKLNTTADWTVQDVVVHDSSPMSKSFFGRHSSMPESPVVTEINKPSTSGMAFGRHNSMPYTDKNMNAGYSPIRCSQEEIKRKRQQAREKLHAKRLLPFTSTQQSSQVLSTQLPQPAPTTTKKAFQPKVGSSATLKTFSFKNFPVVNNNVNLNLAPQKNLNSSPDMKLLIEKKRQEALLKLRRRQPQKP